jgi:hypothetical protein
MMCWEFMMTSHTCCSEQLADRAQLFALASVGVPCLLSYRDLCLSRQIAAPARW